MHARQQHFKVHFVNIYTVAVTVIFKSDVFEHTDKKSINGNVIDVTF